MNMCPLACDFNDIPHESQSQFSFFSIRTSLLSTPCSRICFLHAQLRDWSPKHFHKPTRYTHYQTGSSDSLEAYPKSVPHEASLLGTSDSNEHNSIDQNNYDSNVENSTLNINENSSGDIPSGEQPSHYAQADADGQQCEAPMIAEALEALKDIRKVLHPPQKKGPGYINPELDPFTQSWIKGIESFLLLYTNK
uniref:Uncharacterized protein n=1 Tax=Moniliophthora roreri TaxID=221103 RepID=A0A0W0FI22_MONRR